MLLVFDAVSGERKRGTLKVLLAGPLPRDVVIVSKLLAGLLTVMIPLAMAWVLSLLYTTVAAGITFEGEDLARLLWIGAMSVLYILFFFSVGTAITCWTHRSATALSICLFCWIVFVLAIPNLVQVVVDRFSPIPPESRIVLEKDAIFRQWQKTRQPKVYAELSATGKYDDIYELWDELMRIRREELDAESEKIDRFYKSRIEQQLRLNQAMSRLSPSAAMVYATTHLAGTGVRDFLRLISDVDAFGREYGEVKDQLEKERREKFKDADDRWPEAVEDAYDPTRYPPFEPGREQLAAVLDQSWIDIVLLFGGSIVFLLLSVIGFVRYDPR
jgi:ABC-type transport system involved in multi-copper enzyme maturation permease subunit